MDGPAAVRSMETLQGASGSERVRETACSAVPLMRVRALFALLEQRGKILEECFTFNERSQIVTCVHKGYYFLFTF